MKFKITSIILTLLLIVSGIGIAADDFNGSPQFQEKVENGELPEVSERLPENPKVVDNIEIGKYGGELAVGMDSAYGFGGYNWYSESGPGNVLSYLYEPLITAKNPDRTEYEPNLAKSWEVSGKGKTISFTLRKGIKWSDGEEFTTEDIAFTYNDIVLNENLPVDDWWTKVGGEAGKLIVEDKYNFRFEFPKPNPMFLEWLTKHEIFPIMAKHEMSQYHPKYNEEKNYEDFLSARGFDTTPVSLTAWIMSSGSSSVITAKRNPYYWKVDEEGNQLPYIDRTVFRAYQERQALAMSLLSGEVEVIIDGGASDVLPTILDLEDQRDYECIFTEIGWAFSGNMFNWDSPNPNHRKLFREENFIKAMKYGVNRKKIEDAIPVVDAMYGVFPPPGTPYYEEDYYTEYHFNPEKARKLLDEIGIKDYNGDGWRQYPKDYPDPKATVEFQIMAGSGHSTRLTGFEIVANQYKENLGIKAELSPTPSSIFWQTWPEGEWEVWGRWAVLDFVMDEPLRLIRTFGKVGDTVDDVPRFSTKSALEDPADWVVKTGELLQEASATVKYKERKELIMEALKIFSEKAPLTQLWMEKLWRGVPKESLVGNIPYFMWPDQFVAGHGQQAQIHQNIEYWYRK